MNLLSVEEAQARALAVAPRPRLERVMVRDALGRVLAEEVLARADVPPHDNSAMDGFALRAADVVAGGELALVGEVAAGHVAKRSVGAGEAIKIMTGAPMPAGADAVVMVEHTETRDARVKFTRTVQPGENVRRAGDDLRRGQRVLSPGVTLQAAELGVLASLQRASVQVARPPEVAVLVTGDELRDVDQPLEPGAIADSNSYTLDALIRHAGARPRVLPIVRDDKALLARAIEEARSADLIVSSGGVSVGEHDHVKAVLAELGATLELWRVSMKPGKPVAIARLGATPFFGLPGNPVSTMVSFLLFVRPAIRQALGCTNVFDPTAKVILDSPFSVRGDRRTYVPVELRFVDGELRASAFGRQGSHRLTTMLGANALLVGEPGTNMNAGDVANACVFGRIG